MIQRWPMLLVFLAFSALAEGPTSGASPRTSMLELKFGPYRPLLGNEAGLGGQNPYAAAFGGKSMMRFEAEYDRELYQGFGTAAVGLSVGYAERYGAASGTDANGNPVATGERTALFVVPIQLLGVYRMDYPAQTWGIPLVPYLKTGLVYMPWWSTKGGHTYSVGDAKSSGAKWGYQFTAGLSFLLDVIEPQLARDFDTDIGVNHSYLFAEFVYANVDNFGKPGLVLSSRHFLFGIAFEF